jgi:hypothetical protein
MGVGGKRPGAGRPLGSPGLKSQALAGRLDEMGYDPAETLVRLGRRAEEAGNTDLAIKAAIALMSFRWPKLKETQTELGLGLSNSLADRLESAQARLQIIVTSGIDRPPDGDAIEAAPAASDPVEQIDPPPPSPPQPPTSPSPAASPPKLRPVASSPPAPEPPPAPGRPIPAHQYWAAKPER